MTKINLITTDVALVKVVTSLDDYEVFVSQNGDNLSPYIALTLLDISSTTDTEREFIQKLFEYPDGLMLVVDVDEQHELANFPDVFDYIVKPVTIAVLKKRLHYYERSRDTMHFLSECNNHLTSVLGYSALLMANNQMNYSVNSLDDVKKIAEIIHSNGKRLRSLIADWWLINQIDNRDNFKRLSEAQRKASVIDVIQQTLKSDETKELIEEKLLTIKMRRKINLFI